MKKKTTRIAIIVCVVAALIVGGTFLAANTGDDFKGISITYRETSTPNVIALDFRAHGVAGNTFVSVLEYDKNVMKPVTPDGADPRGIKAAVKDMPVGSASDDDFLKDLDNTDDLGWAFDRRIEYVKELPLVNGVPTEKTYDNVVRLVVGSKYESELRPLGYPISVKNDIIPPADGLGLYTIYFTPVQGKSLADIDKDTFNVFGTGGDSPRGVSIISGNGGFIVADGVKWIDVPGKTNADNRDSSDNHQDLNPGDLKDPDNPNNPNHPDNPDNPDKPNNPNNPSDPNEPDGPSNLLTLEKTNHYKYLTGYEDGSLRPDANITREEVSTILYRLLTQETRDSARKTTTTFPDVEADRWSVVSIATMQGAGIVTGYEDNTFKPGDNISRAEFAAMIMRFEPSENAATHNFKDVDSSHWAEDYIAAAAERELVNGYEDGTFKPDQFITRAEAVTIINRLLERVVDEEGLLDALIVSWADLKTSHWAYDDLMEATMSHLYERRAEGKPMENWTGKGTDMVFD